MQSLNELATAKAVEERYFALCTVVVAETPTRQLIQPRTPKQGAFLFLNELDMNYKVSEQTAGIIQAYDMINPIYECVYKSLCKSYREDEALAIIEEKLMPGLKALEDSIFRLVALSIKERRGDIGNDEI